MSAIDSPKVKPGETPDATENTEAETELQDESPSERKASKGSYRAQELPSPAKTSKRHMRPRDFDPEPPEKPRFKKEHHIRMKHKMAQREEDLRQVRDKCDRELLAREERFEDMISDITVQDKQNVQAGILLMDQQQAAQKKKAATYAEWDTNVYNRITFRLNKCLNPNDDAKGNLDDMELRAGFDPLKRQMHEQQKEDTFRRESNSLLFSIAERPSESERKEQTKKGGEKLTIKELEQIWTERSTIRPVLDTVYWSQERYPTTVDGLSANTGRREDGKFHTQKRRGEGRHLPDEKGDNTESAGKTRTRLEGHNYMGVLDGNWAKRGSAYKFQAAYGASHAVPCGDHYRFETGVVVTDREFPLGKRVFKNMK